MDAVATPYRHRAQAAGLTEPLVREVLVAFYEKVKKDPALGPVFAEIIGDDWDAHMERIVSFWLSMTRLGTGYRSRGFIPAHVKHASIRAAQLPQWLRLFRETTGELCTPEAAAVLVDIAERMADSVRMSLDRRDQGRAA